MIIHTLILVLILPFAVLGQNSEVALGTYAANGKLISITNLSKLSDCPVRSGEGFVKNVKVEGGRAFVRIEDKKKKFGIDFEIPLERLEVDERNAIFKDLVKKKLVLRFGGYSCDSNTVVAFSVDRVY